MQEKQTEYAKKDEGIEVGSEVIHIVAFSHHGATDCWLCHSGLARSYMLSLSIATLLKTIHGICRSGMVTVGKSYLRREIESNNFCGIVIKTNPSQFPRLLPSNFCTAVHHARK